MILLINVCKSSHHQLFKKFFFHKTDAGLVKPSNIIGKHLMFFELVHCMFKVETCHLKNNNSTTVQLVESMDFFLVIGGRDYITPRQYIYIFINIYIYIYLVL